MKIRLWQWVWLPVLIIVWVTLLNLEHTILYPSVNRHDSPMNSVPAEFRSLIQDVYFPSGKETINAWFIPGKPAYPVVLMAHGNGGHIGFRCSIYKGLLEHGFGVFAFDYPGYGKSTGEPNESNLYQVVTDASTYVARQYHVAPSSQIALGESLGTGVMVDAATHIPFKALVLLSPYTSMADEGRYVVNQPGSGLAFLRGFPLDWILPEKFDSLGKINRVHMPLLIVHGDADNIAPVTMGKRLYEAYQNNRKQLLIIPGAGHNDMSYKGTDPIMETIDRFVNASTALHSDKTHVGQKL